MARIDKSTFFDLVVQTFAFLPNELGFDQPTFRDDVLPVVTYEGPVCEYRMFLDDGTVMTSVAWATPDRRYLVALPLILQVAGLGRMKAGHVRAHSMEKLRASLESQAQWIRTIHPLMIGPTGLDLVQQADAL